MEGDIIPMCEDQGMAVLPWSALGSGQLLSAEQRRERQSKGDAPYTPPSERAISISQELEKIANEKSTTLQAIVSNWQPYN